MKKVLILLVALSFVFAGCGGGTQYKDASQDKGSRTWGPKEIKDTVGKMVVSLYTFLKEEKSSYIQVKKVRNRTDEHIDTKMLQNALVTNLIKKRIRFIDKSFRKSALKEIEEGMTGMIDPDSAIPAGMLKSPNFYLAGDISSNTRVVGSKSKQFLVVTLKLVELATGALLWQEQQEFFKVSSTKKTSW